MSRIDHLHEVHYIIFLSISELEVYVGPLYLVISNYRVNITKYYDF